MIEGIDKIKDAIIKDVHALASIVLENASNGNDEFYKHILKDIILKDEVKVKVESLGDGDIVIQTVYSDYVDYVQNSMDSKQNLPPPIDLLRDWALSRNIPTDNSTLFLIGRSIWRTGQGGKPILESLENEIENYFDTELSEMLFEAISDELDKYFN